MEKDGAKLQLELINRKQTAALVKKGDTGKRKKSEIRRSLYVTLFVGKLSLPANLKGMYTLLPANWRFSVEGRAIPILSPVMLKKRYISRLFKVKEYAALLTADLYQGGKLQKGAKIYPGITCLPGEVIVFRFIVPRLDFRDGKAFFSLRLLPSNPDKGKPVFLRVPVKFSIKKIKP